MSQRNDIPLNSPDRPVPSGKRAAREILVLCTTAGLSPEGKARVCAILSEKVDWDYLLHLAEFHGIAPLLAHNFLTNSFVDHVPPPCREQLSTYYHNNLYRNMILADELAKVLALFRRNGITALNLKGTILAEQLYGNPGLRTVTDMDIMVTTENLSLGGSLLLELGYRQMVMGKWWEHPFHLAPYGKIEQFPFIIELHWNLDDPKLVSVPLEEVWERARPVQIHGNNVLVLSPEDELLFLANHLFKHDTRILMSLGDIAELLKKYENTLDWDAVEKSAFAWQVDTSLYYSLKRARELLKAKVPDSVIAALRPGRLRRVLLDGLYSRRTFVAAINSYKIRSETAALFRGLLMENINQTFIVLSRHRAQEGWWGWLGMFFWAGVVLGFTLLRNLADLISREAYG
jgi:hypothetical protein